MDIRNVIRLMKKIYERWDVRGLMLMSLFLQTALVLLAPLRKRSSNKWVIGILLCLYLLADWAANFAAGVISSSDVKNQKKGQPLAFWSTFLLVHLGGPDSITAFSMQDNDFWHRHALALVFQCVSATYIFFQTLAQNQLWIPTLLMFVSGFIRYYERTKSLYLASLNTLRDSMRKDADPGANYEKIMDVYGSKRESKLPTRIEMINRPDKPRREKEGRLGRIEAVLYAHRFFKTFRRLIVDVKCSHRKRVQSRLFFLNRTAADAFHVLALEQNFMYGILFTKAISVYTRRGYWLRSLSFALVVTSSILFYCEEKKSKPSDVAISYTLLGGAIALDVIGFYQFFASNWLTASIHKLHDASLIEHKFDTDDVSLSVDENATDLLLERPRFHLVRTLLAGSWSESVSGHNLIEYCLSPREPEKQKMMDCFGITRFFDGLKYVRRTAFTEGLRNHIFKEVKSKSESAEDLQTAKEASTARGNWTLHLERGCRDLLPYVLDVDYDQSLLTWHIATEICWWVDDGDMDQQEKKHKEFSKILSDYMLYLVTMQPAIMHGVTDIGQTRLWDTIAEIRRAYDLYLGNKKPRTLEVIKYALKRCCVRLFFSTIVLLTLPLFVIICLPLVPLGKLEKLVNFVKPCKYCSEVLQFLGLEKEREPGCHEMDLCRKIYNVNTEVEPGCIKGYRSKSVLYDGCRLAKDLMKLEESPKWEVMSRVWVEMLSYPAVRSRPQALAEQWSKGGELISFVWLLMAHFGVADVFEDCDGDQIAKLIVEK